MRRLTILAFLICVTVLAFSQTLPPDSGFVGRQQIVAGKKFNYGVTLGSQFTSVSGYGSAMNTYVAPRFSYNLSKRFTLGAGLSIIQTNYFNARSFTNNELNSGHNGNFTSAMIHVDGLYKVNERLTLSGSAFKQFPITRDPLPYNPFNPVSAKGAQGVNFNVGYKIGEHTFIEAGFRYSEGLNPYASDPFYRNSFMNDAFGTQTGFGYPRW